MKTNKQILIAVLLGAASPLNAWADLMASSLFGKAVVKPEQYRAAAGETDARGVEGIINYAATATAFLIDDASFDTPSYHNCGKAVRAVTSNEIAVGLKLRTPIEVIFGVYDKEEDEVKYVTIHPLLSRKSLISGLAVLDLTQSDIRELQKLGEGNFPYCMGFSKPSANVGKTGFLGGTPASAFLPSFQTVSITGKIPSSLYIAYDFSHELDMYSDSGMRGALVYGEDNDLAGMILERPVDKKAVLAPIAQVAEQLKSLVRDSKDKGDFNFEYFAEYEGRDIDVIRYEGVLFTPITKQKFRSYKLEQTSGQVYGATPRDESVRSNFADTRVQISGLDKNSRYAYSFGSINSSGKNAFGSNPIWLVHSLHGRKVKDIYDVIRAINGHRRVTPDSPALQLTFRDKAGSRAYVLTGSSERELISKLSLEFPTLVATYSRWLNRYVEDNPRARGPKDGEVYYRLQDPPKSPPQGQGSFVITPGLVNGNKGYSSSGVPTYGGTGNTSSAAPAAVPMGTANPIRDLYAIQKNLNEYFSILASAPTNDQLNARDKERLLPLVTDSIRLLAPIRRVLMQASPIDRNTENLLVKLAQDLNSLDSYRRNEKVNSSGQGRK